MSCSVALPRIRPKPEYHEIRRWDRADWSAVCLDMPLADWEPMLRAVDVDAKLDEFMVIGYLGRRHRPTLPHSSDEIGASGLSMAPR